MTATATALTELLLRDSARRSNLLATRLFVPGSAVRGHLAQRWLRRGRPVDATFREVFESGRVRFRHAYPRLGDVPTIPAPLTLRHCKTGSGAGHLAGDTSATVGPPVCTHPDHAVASPDGRSRGATRRLRGLVTAEGRQVTADQLTIVRTRIGTVDDSDGSGQAAEGALFTERRLRAGTTFQLVVEGPQELLERLLELVDTEGDLLTVGRARSVSGALELDDIRIEHLPVADPLQGEEHTLTFLSDAILLDEHQLAVTDLTDGACLARVLTQETGRPWDAELLEPAGTSQIRTTEVGGWDAIDGTPKPVDVAVAAGSVIRFRTSDLEAVNALADLPWLGWRRSEGYGHVAIDHPLHRQGLTLPPPPIKDRTPTVDADRDAQARTAQAVAARISSVSRTAWQGIEDTVRRGQRPVLQIEPDHQGQHAQSRSGRGYRAGMLQRQRRNHAIEEFLAACLDAGIEVPSTQAAVFADDIGRELDLLRGGRQ